MNASPDQQIAGLQKVMGTTDSVVGKPTLLTAGRVTFDGLLKRVSTALTLSRDYCSSELILVLVSRVIHSIVIIERLPNDRQFVCLIEGPLENRVVLAFDYSHFQIKGKVTAFRPVDGQNNLT